MSLCKQPLFFRSIFAAAVMSFPAAVSVQELHIVHCLNGSCPTGAPATNDLLVREIYALSNNGNTKFADWVAYRVTSETIGTSASLKRSWKPDNLLNHEDTLEIDDFRGANAAIDTDRGHQAPLAAFASTTFWRTTNFLSNITPQKSALNQGPWQDLESAVRDTAYELKELYVVTGPLFDRSGEELKLPNSDEDHRIPDMYFKIIAHEGRKSLAAFIFGQNSEESMNYCDGAVKLAEVERRSGLKVFPHAPKWTNDLLSELDCH